MNKDELIEYCKEAGQTISELDYKNRMLEKENKKLKERIHKALKMIWENYGVLDKYGIELLEDILKGV